MTDFAQRRANATPQRETGRVCFDLEARAALAAALNELASITHNQTLLDDPEGLDELDNRIRELDAQVDEATDEFVFERIPKGEWRAIEDDHPATDAQREANPEQKLNDLTFEPAIAAATCVEPGLSVEDATWLRDFLPDDEWHNQVVLPLTAANKAGTRTPKGASGIASRLISELRSITAPSEGSPSPSSEDG